MAADPAQRTVLLLKANPASTVALDLEAEYQAIAQSLGRAAKHRTIRVVAEAAVTDDDLRRALLDHEPEIVHFSGHGAGRRGLVFEDAGEPLFISGDALADLLGLCSGHVKCVVLNACYSDVQVLNRGRPMSAVWISVRMGWHRVPSLPLSEKVERRAEGQLGARHHRTSERSRHMFHLDDRDAAAFRLQLTN